MKITDTSIKNPIRLILQCKLTVEVPQLLFKLTRQQYPLQLAYAMSINKAQGQSLSHIGVDLRAQVFAHSQLYVALSRTTNADNVSVLVSTDNKEYTVDNVV